MRQRTLLHRLAGTSAQSCRVDIRSGEIVTLEQQRLAGRLCECVGEAVSEVQCGRMIPLAEAAPCAARCFQVFHRDGHQLDLRTPQERVEVMGRQRRLLDVPNAMEDSSTLATDMRQG